MDKGLVETSCLKFSVKALTIWTPPALLGQTIGSSHISPSIHCPYSSGCNETHRQRLPNLTKPTDALFPVNLALVHNHSSQLCQKTAT
ncbi:conserved hypothetical protein [Ricinus communis]|uniref:Uncharacterized protein n=1 Tax=Ricinus communis TaxID=3988 RepID=B9RMV3_RICCO|nr:conserved hypothetical protein [Ricinus communis]